MNTVKVHNQIVQWIKQKIKTTEVDGIVLGISGGIDSSVAAALSVEALSKECVHGIIMPYYRDNHFDDALDMVNINEIPYSTIWINGIYDSLYDTGLLWKNKTKENTMSRIRMVLLRAYANEHNLLLVGTGNASETMIGYCTKGGDSEADIFPLYKLTKGQVYQLAAYINELHGKTFDAVPHIPEEIILKKPSAGLSPEQTDENDLGMTYKDIDKLVTQFKFGVPAQDVSDKTRERFNILYKTSAHKRSGIQYPDIPGIDLVPYFGKR